MMKPDSRENLIAGYISGMTRRVYINRAVRRGIQAVRQISEARLSYNYSRAFLVCAVSSKHLVDSLLPLVEVNGYCSMLFGSGNGMRGLQLDEYLDLL